MLNYRNNKFNRKNSAHFIALGLGLSKKFSKIHFSTLVGNPTKEICIKKDQISLNFLTVS